MKKREKNLWEGIHPRAQKALTARDYRTASFAQELAQRGVDAGEVVTSDKNQREIKEAWIPGVEIAARIRLQRVNPNDVRLVFTNQVTQLSKEFVAGKCAFSDANYVAPDDLAFLITESEMVAGA